MLGLFMSFVPELQRPIWLCSFALSGAIGVKVVVRHEVPSPEVRSPIGRAISDVMSDVQVITPSPTYELSFVNVIVSSVSEDFAFRDDETAVGEGVQFARFEKSKFLDFLNLTCYEPDILTGPRYHYVLRCLNGRVDVVAREAPVIRLIGETSL
jgi:hypothetical protein